MICFGMEESIRRNVKWVDWISVRLEYQSSIAIVQLQTDLLSASRAWRLTGIQSKEEDLPIKKLSRLTKAGCIRLIS